MIKFLKKLLKSKECVIVNLKMTCWACPSQWEGQLLDGSYIYIRYRYGILSYGIGSTPDEAVSSRTWSITVGDSLDGSMNLEEMLNLTGFKLQND